MIKHITHNGKFMADYMAMMLKDIPDSDLTTPEGKIVNHPA